MRFIPLGMRYMIGSALLFSVMSVLVKVAGERLPSQEIVLARGLVTLVLSWAMLRRAGVSVWGHSRGLLVLRGLFGFAGLSCFYFAVTNLPLGEATVIQYTSPVFTAVLAAVFLRERFSGVLVLSTAICVGGVVVVTQPAALFGGAAATALNPAHVAIGLAGAVFSALAYVVVRRLAATENALVIVFYFPLVAVPATIPGVAMNFVMPQGWEWVVLLGVGVTTQAAQVLLTKGLALEQAGKAMAATYLQIVFAVGWGMVIFGEWPGTGTVMGGVMVVLGTGIVALRRSGGEGSGGERGTGNGERERGTGNGNGNGERGTGTANVGRERRTWDGNVTRNT